MVVKGIRISMAESSVAISPCKTHLHLQKKKKKKQKDITDPDMAAAAQQLMQLSDDNSNSGRNYNKVDDNGYGDEEVDQRVVKENGNYVINSGEENSSSSSNNNNNIMEEIFGKEEVLVFPAANRKRRYRSLVDIYMETKPVVYHILWGTTAKKLRS